MVVKRVLSDRVSVRGLEQVRDLF